MSSGPEVLALVGFLAVTAGQRVLELAISARNARAVKALGAREFGRDQFPWIALLHGGYLVSLTYECLVLGARSGRLWPVWLAFWLGAQALRYAAIQALGRRWNVRVWVVPGSPRVRTGIYRVLPHPNYLAVAVELIAGPLLFGAWRTALLATLLDAWVLRRRIVVEEEALKWSECQDAPDGTTEINGHPSRGVRR